MDKIDKKKLLKRDLSCLAIIVVLGCICYLFIMVSIGKGPSCTEFVKEQDVTEDKRGVLRVQEVRCSAEDETVVHNTALKGPKYYNLFDGEERIGIAYYDDIDPKKPIQFYFVNRIQTFDPYDEYNKEILIPYQYNVKKKRILFTDQASYSEDVFLDANYINSDYGFSLKTPQKDGHLGYIVIEKDKSFTIIKKGAPYGEHCWNGKCIDLWDEDPPLPKMAIIIQTPEESMLSNEPLQITERKKMKINNLDVEKLVINRSNSEGIVSSTDMYLIYSGDFVYRFLRFEGVYSEIFNDVAQSFKRIPIIEKRNYLL